MTNDQRQTTLLSTVSRLLEGIRTLGAGVSFRAILYPYRKAYYEGKFTRQELARKFLDDELAHSQSAHQAEGSRIRGIKALLGRGVRQEGDSLPAYTRPGRVLAHRWHPGQNPQLELNCENATAQITVLAPDLMRARVSTTGQFPPPFSYAVAKNDHEWPATECTLEETASALVIRTSRLHCRITKAHLYLTYLDPDGTVIADEGPPKNTGPTHNDGDQATDSGGVAWRDNRVIHSKQLLPGEHIYGLGQKTTSLDKRGHAFEMWNTDPQTYQPGDDPIYSNIPFYLGVHSGQKGKTYGYGMFIDNSARAWFDFGARTPAISRFQAHNGETRAGDVYRYYFFYGPKLTTVLERYTELTGRMVMPPLWALGYHQNRWSYYPEARVREIAGEFRRRRIPCEAIHLDIDYMDGFRCFTWHADRFPDPAKLIADLHAEGFKVVVMADPGIKTDRRYWVCREGLEQGVFCTYPDGTLFSGPVWPGECYFPDFTSPRVRAWWGELYREMVDLGIDGFWNDMNEPAVFGHVGDTLPDVVQHEWEGHGTDHREAHNVYGMQMARATVEGLTQLRPTERPLVISRSVWAGSQRYNMHWLGDNCSDWAALRNTIQLALNMGLSGIAFTGPDTGGFAGTADGELLIRWNQLSTFTPFFRNHTAKGTGDQEPWALGGTCERISRKFIELRYRLLPYHYAAFWQSAQSGIPMMRPLFLAFQDDPHAIDADGCPADDEYMFGDAFLVAPIVEPGGVSRRVYIPPGRWYDFWQDTLTAGPQITSIEAPLDRMPLLVRAGSIVPTWPLMQYIGERPVDILTLHVYPGNGESTLYEDDGHTWAFKEGDYRLTRLTCEVRTGRGSTRLVIERLSEGPFTPAYKRMGIIIHGTQAALRGIRVDGKPVTTDRLDPQNHFETGLFHVIELQFDTHQGTL